MICSIKVDIDFMAYEYTTALNGWMIIRIMVGVIQNEIEKFDKKFA